MDRGEYRRRACEPYRGRESPSRTASSTGCSAATRRIVLPSTFCETTKTDAFFLLTDFGSIYRIANFNLLFVIFFFDLIVFFFPFLSVKKEAVEAVERGECERWTVADRDFRAAVRIRGSTTVSGRGSGGCCPGKYTRMWGTQASGRF